MPRITAAAVLALVGVAAAACTDTTTGPGTLRFQANPCLPGDTVALQAAEAVRIDCGNGGTTVTLAGNGASYLVVPEFATDQAPFALVTYSVATGEVVAPSAAVGRMPAAMRLAAARGVAGTRSAARPSLAQLSADRMLRERGQRAAVGSALPGANSGPPRPPPPPRRRRPWAASGASMFCPTSAPRRRSRRSGAGSPMSATTCCSTWTRLPRPTASRRRS